MGQKCFYRVQTLPNSDRKTVMSFGKRDPKLETTRFSLGTFSPSLTSKKSYGSLKVKAKQEFIKSASTHLQRFHATKNNFKETKENQKGKQVSRVTKTKENNFSQNQERQNAFSPNPTST